VVRDRALAVTIGGLLLGGSIVGVAPGAAAATAAHPSAGVPIARVAERFQHPIEHSGLIPSRAHTRVIDRVAILRASRAVGARGVWRHLCLGFVRTRFGLPKVESSAIEAWRLAQHKHRYDRHPPAGVPVFWSGGSRGHGHVAVSLGHGMIVSTDIPYTGHVARTYLSAPGRRWGLRYLGWTEDLEGVRIYRR
jgi:hypothetical protein